MHPEPTQQDRAPRAIPRRARRYRLVALGLGCLIGFLVLEVFLRLYPPLAFRVQGGRLALPVHQRTVIRNDRIERLDREIVHSRNSIGFRGSDPPNDFQSRLTVVAVGGSTTECYYLSDEKTWPEQLRQQLADRFPTLWVNNAGLDGHSTFGHAMLLDQYLRKLQPQVIVYLVGVNDIGHEGPLDFDRRLVRDASSTANWGKKFYLTLTQWSASLALVDNLQRHYRARSLGLTHDNVTHRQLLLDQQSVELESDEVQLQALTPHRERYVPAYAQRLRQLIEATRDSGSEPVLVTQPALYGDAVDPVTRADLARVRVQQRSGHLQWRILELYNDATRDVAGSESVELIDLARTLPKSSELFYDYLHFTNEGARLVGQQLAAELEPFLARQQEGQAAPRDP